MNDPPELQIYCDKWKLANPVRLAATFTSDVYVVEHEGTRAALKLLNAKGRAFEARSARVLRAFNGNGTVEVLDAEEGALLLEFIDGPMLKSVVADGNDDQATHVLCDVMDRLHSYSGAVPDRLFSMERNFRELFFKAGAEPPHSTYAAGAKLAKKLIADERETRLLHGDIHHENVLQSPERGWLAIDPQGLVGERTYDTANAFYNPDGFESLVESEATIHRRCQIFSERLGLKRRRILEFAFAYGCLSAAWSVQDGQSPAPTLRIARIIQGLLLDERVLG